MDEVLEQGRMSSTALDLLTQTKAEEELQTPTQPFCTDLQNPGADTIWTCSFVLVQSLQLFLFLHLLALCHLLLQFSEQPSITAWLYS